jgi:hypothetical protein
MSKYVFLGKTFNSNWHNDIIHLKNSLELYNNIFLVFFLLKIKIYLVISIKNEE